MPANGASGACFATSKELSEHCRAEHADRSCDDRPYRCGLDGCGKSWKVCPPFKFCLVSSNMQARVSMGYNITCRCEQAVAVD